MSKQASCHQHLGLALYLDPFPLSPSSFSFRLSPPGSSDPGCSSDRARQPSGAFWGDNGLRLNSEALEVIQDWECVGQQLDDMTARAMLNRSLDLNEEARGQDRFSL